MDLIQIPFGDIAELGTHVGMHGAISMGDVAIDEVFDLIVGIVLLVVEIVP